ncbi:hypothetical protein HPB50_028127 [Hyalomma asiaticum]|nr:hypothetical protein HPB50_028127 [Hyalomma asiaticum]
MASQKRRKAYLDPESTTSVPRSTKWRLLNSASGSSGSSRASRRTAVQADQRPSCSNSPHSLRNNSDNESQSSRQRTDTDYVDFEPTGDIDDDYSDSAGSAGEESEHVISPDTSFSDHEDEISGVFGQPCDSFNVEELTLPFTEGGRLTRGDTYMMLLDIAVKFGLSWTAIEEIQRLHLADTKDNLDERKRLHTVCDMCRTQYSGSDHVRSGSFFVSMPIKKQLASILSSKTVGSAVMSSLTRKHSAESAMTDVTDGAHYQKVRQNIDRSDITVTLNSDGSPVFCICCCADSPARAAMQHMVQFNGYYGCSWCYHPGVNVDGTVKYCLTTPFPDRTDEEALQDMRDACNTGATADKTGGFFVLREEDFSRKAEQAIAKNFVRVKPSATRVKSRAAAMCKDLELTKLASHIEGFVDLGGHTPADQKNVVADHGMVVLFQPFTGNWTQILGVFASKSNVMSRRWRKSLGKQPS